MLCHDCDLKLSQVFRTPKDFSRVNFDHFEILERNNFDTSADKGDPTTNNAIYTSPQAMPKSIANAQIMLRFGGDDIHGKNHLGTTGKFISKPFSHYNPSLRHYCHYSEVPHPHPHSHPHPHFPYYPTEIYPSRPVIPGEALTPSYPPPYSYFPYSAAPPLAFPGIYYNHMNNPGVHLSLQQALTGLKKGQFAILLFIFCSYMYVVVVKRKSGTIVRVTMNCLELKNYVVILHSVFAFYKVIMLIGICSLIIKGYLTDLTDLISVNSCSMSTRFHGQRQQNSFSYDFKTKRKLCKRVYHFF